MPFFDELVNISISPLIAIVLAVITFHFPSFVNMLLLMIVAPMLKLKVKQIGLLGFRYEKQKDGKWESRGYKPMSMIWKNAKACLPNSLGIKRETCS